jgi:hypothetical protein
MGLIQLCVGIKVETWRELRTKLAKETAIDILIAQLTGHNFRRCKVNDGASH